ncbi:MAG: DedA family protein [Patescibacteria group bacterium]
MPSLPEITQWLIQYGYFVLFPIMVIEGPIITVIAGFLSSVGALNPFIAYAVVVAGDLAGDSIYYFLGRSGRYTSIERWGRFLGITPARVARLETHFGSHTGKTLIAGKLTHAVGSVILTAAGVARVPYRRFLWYNFLATIPKSLVFLLIGFYFGSAIARINRFLTFGTLAMIALLALTVLGYAAMQRWAKKLDKDL